MNKDYPSQEGLRSHFLEHARRFDRLIFNTYKNDINKTKTKDSIRVMAGKGLSKIMKFKALE